MINTTHGRRIGQLCDVPRIPNLLELFNFEPSVSEPVFACRKTMINGKPTEWFMKTLAKHFGTREFDATDVALKFGRPRQSMSDVLRTGANLGMFEWHTKKNGAKYYRIKA